MKHITSFVSMFSDVIPSSLSTSFCSFLTVFSAYSARASASFSFEVRVFSCFLNSSTRWLAFSSDTSRDLRELPTTWVEDASCWKILEKLGYAKLMPKYTPNWKMYKINCKESSSSNQVFIISQFTVMSILNLIG